jgi:O-antigen/teichoic acid export membrane protein
MEQLSSAIEKLSTFLNMGKKISNQIIVRALGVIVSFSLLAVISHILQKDEFGIYSLVILYSNLLLIFGSFGVSEVLKFEAAKGQLGRDVIDNVLFNSAIIWGLILLSLSFAIIFIIFIDLNTAIVYLFIPIFFLVNLLAEMIFARLICIGSTLRGSFFYFVLRHSLFLIFILILYLIFEANLFLILSAQALIYLVVVIWYLKDIKFKLSFFKLPFFFKLNWRHGANNVILMGVSTVILSIDSIMLSAYSNLSEVANYNFVSKIIQIPSFLLFALNPIVTSFIINNSKKITSIDFNKYIFRNLCFSLLFFLLSASLLILFWPLLFIFFNPIYIDSLNIFLILLGYKLLEVIFSWYGTTLNICGNSLWIAKISLIPLTVSILLNYLLIPKYGAIGAAIATFISMGIYYVSLGLKYYLAFNNKVIKVL